MIYTQNMGLRDPMSPSGAESNPKILLEIEAAGSSQCLGFQCVKLHVLSSGVIYFSSPLLDDRTSSTGIASGVIKQTQ